MPRYIDADAFEVVTFEGSKVKSDEFMEGAAAVLEMLDAAPTIDVERGGRLRGVTYEDGKVTEVHIMDTDDAVKVFKPVVRCWQCKYRFRNNGHDNGGCPIVDAHIWMDDDDFCSHGERKEGAE